MNFLERKNQLRDIWLHKRFLLVKDPDITYSAADYRRDKANLDARFFGKTDTPAASSTTQNKKPELSPREIFDATLQAQLADFIDKEDDNNNTRHINHVVRTRIMADLADQTSRKPGFNAEPGLRHCV